MQVSHSPQEMQKEPTTKSPGGYGGDLGADFYDLADVFVAHCAVVDGLCVCAAVGPQVGAADAGCCELDDGVGGFEQGRLLNFR